ncbi:MAG TPA: hypothetical protein VFA66_06790 [Gaiellaceae bacterium]|nr:hypothetical protein [Gaiellaceae bacterium]
MTSVAVAGIRLASLKEQDREIVLWRVDQFRRLGYADEDAWSLALSDADLGDARLLVRQGCPPETALRILL